MATVVEHPLGAFSSRSNPLRRSRSNSIEIIDVDTFEEPPSTSQTRRPLPRPSSRPQSTHPDPILIDSDDDEIEFVASRLRPGHDVDRSRSHRRFISPAPRDPSAPPPVPPIPRRFAGHTSFPIHSHPPIIPSAVPLPFERPSAPPVARPPAPPVVRRSAPFRRSAFSVAEPRTPAQFLQSTPLPLPRRGVPPSHFQPAMGLGGALLSSNRVQAQQHQQAVESVPAAMRTRHRHLSLAARRISRGLVDSFSVTDRDDDFYIHMLLNPFMDADRNDLLPSRWSLNYIRGSIPQDEKYHQSYTHPSPPEPGFTYDFAAPLPSEENASNGHFFPPTSKEEPIILDDDDTESQNKIAGPSTSRSDGDLPAGSGQLSALLVCAKCLDPLVLNASLAADEGELKRVWALRCGHLIDEKCLNILGQPPVEDVMPDKKGKGKAKTPVARRAYGTGTLVGQEEEEENPPTQPPPQQEQQYEIQAARPEVNSIRSRLRSRQSVPIAPDAIHMFSFAPPDTQPPAKKRKLTRKPKVEAVFEWTCPVPNCGRVHVSVRINGVWGPETEPPAAPRGGKAAGVQPMVEPRGAIAVFA